MHVLIVSAGWERNEQIGPAMKVAARRAVSSVLPSPYGFASRIFRRTTGMIPR